jgi:uncharacterized HAD superfamily protein
MRTERRVIGLDLDDVLMDFSTALYLHHNNRFGTNLNPATDAVGFSLEKIWGCTKKEARERVLNFYHSEDHFAATSIPGASEAIRKLRQDNSIVIITSKPEYLRERQSNWLEKHFPGMFDHVCFTNLYDGDGLKKTKGEACLELRVDVFVDDHIENTLEVANMGVETYLFDRPWNRHFKLPPNISRVYSWSDILARLDYPE